jgi:hypothetical protein
MGKKHEQIIHMKKREKDKNGPTTVAQFPSE